MGTGILETSSMDENVTFSTAKTYVSDLHYMRQDFCETQQDVQNDPRGCFVLNHNMPSSDYQYNSTDDVLRYIQNPRYTPYFSVKFKGITL
jgi:hypothetical protein